MPRLLTKLRIDEVSSVDRGAGDGVRVVLMKRDTPKRDPAVLDAALEKVLGQIVDQSAVATLKTAFHEFRKAYGDQAMTDITISTDELRKMIAEEVAKKKTPTGDHSEVEAAGEAGDDPDDGKDHVIHENNRASKADDDAEKALTFEEFAEMAKARKLGKPAGLKLSKEEWLARFGRKAWDDEDDKPKKRDDMSKRDEAMEVEIAKRDKEIVELRKSVEKLQSVNQRAEFAKRAVDIGLSEADGEMLLKVHKGDPEALAKMEEKFKALSEQVNKGELFREFGATGGALLAKGGDAHEALVAKADELRKSNPDKYTAAQAYVKAMELNPDLAQLEKRQRDARINRAPM